MFGKIIKAEDLTFLENDDYRRMFIKETVDDIIEIFKQFKEKTSRTDQFLMDRPFNSVLINYNISKREYLFSIKLEEYNGLIMDFVATSSPLMEKMYIILKEMDLIFKIKSNIEGVNKDDNFDYTLCTFSKDENRKMLSTGRMLPAFKKKEMIVHNQLHIHIALMIYNMFGKIANNLVEFNNGCPVEIFYGDINFTFKDWVK